MSNVLHQLLLLLPILFSISIVSADYNPALAIEYASASALAYCQPETIQSWSCGDACQNLTDYKYYYTQVFWVAHDETLAFSMIYNPSARKFITTFRGTVGKTQLFLEILEGNAMKYHLADIPGAFADRYFYDHYLSVLRPVFMPNIEQAIKAFPDYEFVFTGHSLGAAMTTLAAFDVVTAGIIPKDQVSLYTFGSPRVGNEVLAHAIEEAIPESYRIVHWKDIVPHVPLCHKDSKGECVSKKTETTKSQVTFNEWSAWHVTNQVFYNEDNTDYVVCKGGEDSKCANQFTFRETTVKDHHYYMNIHLSCKGVSAFLCEEEEVISEIDKL